MIGIDNEELTRYLLRVSPFFFGRSGRTAKWAIRRQNCCIDY
ncbi:hypothetical protein ACLK2I_19805 [Escherichia coli]